MSADTAEMVEEVETTEAKRKFVHVPFDRMECPVEGCETHGTVPGVKRHYTRMHGDASELDWPEIRTGERAAMAEAVQTEEGMKSLKVGQLRELAEAKGIEDPQSMTKAELIEALS